MGHWRLPMQKAHLPRVRAFMLAVPCIAAWAGTAHGRPSTRSSVSDVVAAKEAPRPSMTARAPAAPAVEVSTASPDVTIRTKKGGLRALWLEPGHGLEARLEGPGKLTLVVYQAMGAADGRPDAVLVNVALDGRLEAPVSFKGTKLAGATVAGAPNVTPSKPRTASIDVPAGTHSLVVEAAPASAVALVTLELVPKGARTPSPVIVSKAAHSAAASTASAPPALPPPASEAPLASAASPSRAPALVVPPPAAAPAAPPQPVSDVERRVQAGELRHGLVGSYPPATVREVDGTAERCSRIGPDRPYVFVVDGPGVATLRAYRLAATGDPGAAVPVTILENDVLLTTVDLDMPLARGRHLAEDGALQVSEVKEYKLTVGPKLSRFSIQPSDAASAGLAVAYAFEAREKSSAMALTLDMGGDLGVGTTDLAGQTILTEVSVRERVVEKVVTLPGNDFLGFAATAGVLVPAWRGTPLQEAGIELRASLPFARRMFALAVEGQAIRQDLTARAADPYGGEVSASGSVLGASLLGALVARFSLTERLALYLSAGGGVVYVRASGGRGSSPVEATAWMPAARGAGGVELRAGPGWIALDAGYLYASPRRFAGVFDAYSPAGVPIGLRYRLGL